MTAELLSPPQLAPGRLDAVAHQLSVTGPTRIIDAFIEHVDDGFEALALERILPAGEAVGDGLTYIRRWRALHWGCTHDSASGVDYRRQTHDGMATATYWFTTENFIHQALLDRIVDTWRGTTSTLRSEPDEHAPMNTSTRTLRGKVDRWRLTSGRNPADTIREGFVLGDGTGIISLWDNPNPTHRAMGRIASLLAPVSDDPLQLVDLIEATVRRVQAHRLPLDELLETLTRLGTGWHGTAADLLEVGEILTCETGRR